MFSSGMVKLLSRCRTWWSLTALHYHFETQPIPHLLSWYAHQLPEIVKRYGVVITFVAEIALPALFYSPIREHRITASLVNMALMVVIAATGNYNFFNFQTITLLLVVLDDEFVFKWMPKWIWRILDIQMPFNTIVE